MMPVLKKYTYRIEKPVVLAAGFCLLVSSHDGHQHNLKKIP